MPWAKAAINPIFIANKYSEKVGLTQIKGKYKLKIRVPTVLVISNVNKPLSVFFNFLVTIKYKA